MWRRGDLGTWKRRSYGINISLFLWLLSSPNLISSHLISYHITSHHITSHHITSHHITSHHITSFLVPSSFSLFFVLHSLLSLALVCTLPICNSWKALLNVRFGDAQASALTPPVAIHCIEGVVLLECDRGVCGHHERCLIAWPAREQDQWGDEKERTERWRWRWSRRRRRRRRRRRGREGRGCTLLSLSNELLATCKVHLEDCQFLFRLLIYLGSIKIEWKMVHQGGNERSK